MPERRKTEGAGEPVTALDVDEKCTTPEARGAQTEGRSNGGFANATFPSDDDEPSVSREAVLRTSRAGFFG
jgi:hypothetical protein